jgi:transposase
MSRLAGAIDGMIGVDTHRDTLAAAATDVVGGLLAQTSVGADAAGYRRVLDFARAQVPGRRCWAVEGAGSYGAGLAAFLQAHGERVVEVARPKRPPRRTGAKSDALDAVRAAREALTQDHPLAPRRRGDREALRVLLATRHQRLRGQGERHQPAQGPDRRGAGGAAGRATRAGHQAPDHALRRAPGPALQVAGAPHDRPGAALHRPPYPAAGRRGYRAAGRAGTAGGRGGAVAAGATRRRADQRRPGPGQLVVCRPATLRGRLCGPGRRQPIPASSGQVTRHRLNRSGDRQLNRALHTIVVARLRDDPETRAYAARRRAEGKSSREVRRCLKRAVARQLFKLLERHDRSTVELLRIA